MNTPEVKSVWRSWALVGQFARQHLGVYLFAGAVIATAEFVQVQIPHVIGEFANALSHETSMTTLQGLVDSLVGFSLLYVGIFGLGQFLIGRMGRLFEADLRQRLYAHWQTLSAEFFQDRSVGDLLSHAINDVPAVRESLSGTTIQTVQSVFLIFAVLYMALRQVSPRLTIVCLSPLALIPVIVVLMSSQVRRRAQRVKESLSEMAAFAEESLGAVRLIKATASESTTMTRFTQRVDAIVKRTMASVQINTLMQALLPFVSNISFVVALVYGGWLVMNHAISLGAFVAFTFYLRLLVNPLTQLGQVTSSLQTASASLIRLQTLLDIEPTVRDDPQAVHRVADYTIAVRHLTFRYPGRAANALTDISLDVPAGQVVGIVGRTGAGKSTLLRLLIRQFEPPCETIFLGNHDVRQIALSTLRGELISYIAQSSFLFSTTVRENIGFSLSNPAPRIVETAAKRAQLWDTVQHFPQHMDTLIGERGVLLSGGQRQRAALARGLAQTRARILILDDAMSAVDMKTELAIVEMLEALRGERTLLISSHRIAAVRGADLILVLDSGRIVEAGTHDELLRFGGFYARLARIQDPPVEEGCSS